jgi:MFS family permease
VLVFLSAAMGGGARGLGVLNIFVPIYLTFVLHLDTTTVALMYTVLVVGSVPGPIVAGSLSDRFGRKPLIIGAYIGGAASLALFVLAGDNLLLMWLAIILLSIFNFVESPATAGSAVRPDATGPARRGVLRLLHACLRRRFAVGCAVRHRGRHAGHGSRTAGRLLADGRRLPRRDPAGPTDQAGAAAGDRG